ncbi:conserved domain protein [Staphylococcus aureus subsp. aureus 21318]|nr:conserved domain protein [Staphylococcus aureus subsp. aureus 21318]
MYKNILLGVDTQLKNEKALKEVSKLAGEGTVVTVFKRNQRTRCSSIN